ncbi:MAG: retropepsin-like domain-containing protein [Bacteroidota bacterium]|nr:retropepsin-like domain-containing protein [Bacteroidota bacterium]
MFLLDTYLHSNISRITLIVLLSVAFKCTNHKSLSIDVSPKHFKVQIPFMLSGRGIIINTYWGNKKKHHVLCLDNHSPSWIKSSVIQYDHPFVKSGSLSFKTFTADGSPIQGDVGICDSLSFETILFRNIPFYVMPDHPKDNKNDDGIFGSDVMSKGIWKIDFKKSELTFASSIDSFKEISQVEAFPATFNEQSISVSVDFGNNNVKTMDIDLGYNGYMLMPLKEFNNIRSSTKALMRLGRFDTPAGENIVNDVSILDTVSINHNWFFTPVSSNERAKERLIGLDFFRRFDYVIFDFINKQVYIPKKVW